MLILCYYISQKNFDILKYSDTSNRPSQVRNTINSIIKEKNQFHQLGTLQSFDNNHDYEQSNGSITRIVATSVPVNWRVKIGNWH